MKLAKPETELERELVIQVAKLLIENRKLRLIDEIENKKGVTSSPAYNSTMDGISNAVGMMSNSAYGCWGGNLYD